MSLDNSELNPLNLWNNRLKEARFMSTEKHEVNKGCCYGKLEVPVEIVGAPATMLYIIYRICKCRRYTTQENRSGMKIHNVHDIVDGVEIHLHEECTYLAHYPTDREINKSHDIVDGVEILVQKEGTYVGPDHAGRNINNGHDKEDGGEFNLNNDCTNAATDDKGDVHLTKDCHCPRDKKLSLFR